MYNGHPKGDRDPVETLDSKGTWWEHENMEVLAEHRMTGKASIFNTMHWHRVFNFTGLQRMVLSAPIRMNIEDVDKLYTKINYLKLHRIMSPCPYVYN